MSLSQFIVIAHRGHGRKPSIQLETRNEETARAYAHQWLRETHNDVYVFDTSTYECVLALTHEPEVK